MLLFTPNLGVDWFMSRTTVSSWSPTSIYAAGMEVTVDGVIYVANWWTAGNNPVSNNGVIGSGQLDDCVVRRDGHSILQHA